MNYIIIFSHLFFADEFDLGPDFDTGGPEEQLYDPSPIWPSKIITDAVNQQVMLVWFEYGHSRAINIPFSQVKEVRIIPAEEALKEESHLITQDGKRFMLAYGTDSANNVQTTAIVIGKMATKGRASDPRIQSNPPTPRPTPLLQMGKIDDPNALVDPATLSQTLPNDIKPIDGNSGNQTMGEDPALTAGNGTITKADVNSVIIGEMNRFRACYQREFQKDNSLEGEVVIQFSIDTDGAIKGAKLKTSSLNNSLVEQCILRNFLGLKFPPPAGGTATPIINYPFIFSAGY